MALDADPYRILGLPRGASLDEVKRAYRRLAKVNHPDAAGESALPRFLAIQAAYEQLLGGPEASPRGRRGSGAPRRPWEADPDRSDATRRAYGGRARGSPPGARSTPPNGSGATGGSGGTGRPSPNGRPDTTDGARAPGGTGRTGPSGPAPGRSRRRASGSPAGQGAPPGSGSNRPGDAKRNKATLGSTSYDGAADGPFEPDWGGASWYGTTSGTYWTLNPKEYADPRKHGPEYQARARRAARTRPQDPGRADPGPDSSDEGTAASAADANADPAARPTHSTSSWWDSTAGPTASAPFADEAAPAPDRSARQQAHRPTATTAPPPPDLGRAAGDITRAVTDDRYGGVRGRVVRAIIGWLPIALGIGWAVGELTGCGRFAATCDGATEPFVLLLQVGALAILLLVPALASLATTAALALFAAAVVAALILSATGSAADGDSRRATLGAVLLIAWLVGLAIAVMQRVRAMPSPTRPVS